MGNVVYKYPLVPGEQSVSMPANPRILSVGVQGDDVVVWALVNTSMPNASRRFLAVGTGEMHIALSNLKRCVGTVQMASGIVVHVFDQDGAA